MGANRGIPSYDALLWPTVRALRSLGGSGAISEIVETVVEQSKFSTEQLSVLHGDGPRTEIEYRLAWARTHLKFMGLVDNSTRGVWSLTEPGRGVVSVQINDLHADARRRRQVERDTRKVRSATLDDPQPSAEDDAETSWKDRLLEVVMAMSPPAFERLAQRLLREAGFISVTVTGGGGDGGIDGVGVYRMSLVSFPVYFQCKRYKGTVPPSSVRDFRGAMAGRGEKGLLVSTGSFSGDAKKEATRDGAPPVDLIDGDRLCDLLKDTRSEL